MQTRFYISAALMALMLPFGLMAQEAHWLWVHFVPKQGEVSPQSAALSPAALERRAQQGIPLDKTDLPVDPAYTAQIEALGCDCRPPLRWQDATLCEMTAEQAEQAQALPFISRLSWPNRVGKVARNSPKSVAPQDTGRRFSPLPEMPWWLSQLGFDAEDAGSGRGVRIAVFDDGFGGVDTIQHYRDVMEMGLIKATRSFVADTHDNVYRIGGHGTAVLSLMTGSTDHPMPLESEFYLARTEDMFSESMQEEYNWAAAAEWADSLGVQIIQSSVGYNIFTSRTQQWPSHTIGELTGDSAIITKAADMAARKGILVVNSAGNEGRANWERILFPADGDSVMAVGAIFEDGRITEFSSRGPTADDRIKPDVVAPGEDVELVSSFGDIRKGGGTSYSAPLISVLAAWLWERVPTASNMDIFEAIKRSADRYDDPDNSYGFGLPNAQKALAILSYQHSLADNPEPQPRLNPNPVTDRFTLFLPPDVDANQLELQLIDTSGRMLDVLQLPAAQPEGHFRFYIADLELPSLQSVLIARLYDRQQETTLLEKRLVIIRN